MYTVKTDANPITLEVNIAINACSDSCPTCGSVIYQLNVGRYFIKPGSDTQIKTKIPY